MTNPIPHTKSGTTARIVFVTAFGGLVLGLAAAALLDLLHVKKNDTVIAVAVSGYVVAIFVSIAVAFTASGRARRRLRSTGIAGRGRLVSATETGARINNLPVVELLLEIQVAGRAPYSVRHSEVMGLESAQRLTPGTDFPVLVDRTDPLIVLVDLS